jgi:hypothetical protein
VVQQDAILFGAAMLDEGRPIVAFTLRHDRLDSFWFALLHELAHVAKHLDEAYPIFARVKEWKTGNNERICDGWKNHTFHHNKKKQQKTKKK